jgi:hypothetical protein
VNKTLVGFEAIAKFGPSAISYPVCTGGKEQRLAGKVEQPEESDHSPTWTGPKTESNNLTWQVIEETVPGKRSSPSTSTAKYPAAQTTVRVEPIVDAPILIE